MAKFDFYQREERDLYKILYNRYDNLPEIRGVQEWRNLVEYPFYETLNELRKLGPPPLDCPCLFVSHRQSDVDYAKRIAFLASESHFEYWLDILDPGLQSLPMLPTLSEDQKRTLIAGIIEMAIINSTHVIALITSKTMGSMWVPYEYGRITGIPTVYGRACAWKHPDLNYSPEYLMLGYEAPDENKITNWLDAEMKAWQAYQASKGKYIICKGSWHGDEPDALPQVKQENT